MRPDNTIKSYLALCRISNLPSVWTNVLCASVLALGRFSWTDYLIPACALSCLYMAGMCLNDFCDADHDRIRQPSRPIPSGMITPRKALLLTIILFIIGLSWLFLCPYPAGNYAAVLLIAVIVRYDMRHKQDPSSVLWMATCRFLVFVVTSLAITGKLSGTTASAAGIQFLYVIAISLVARYENRRGTPFSFPAIPFMLAGISLLDGLILAILVKPVWFLAGIAGAAALHQGQRFVKGD